MGFADTPLGQALIVAFGVLVTLFWCFNLLNKVVRARTGRSLVQRWCGRGRGAGGRRASFADSSYASPADHLSHRDFERFEALVRSTLSEAVPGSGPVLAAALATGRAIEAAVDEELAEAASASSGDDDDDIPTVEAV